MICVVEDPDALAAIEESGGFRGTYHVLHGALAPLDGIGPENLRLRRTYAKDQHRLSQRNNYRHQYQCSGRNHGVIDYPDVQRKKYEVDAHRHGSADGRRFEIY